jgi:curved DNA-binding protein CbpA
MKNHYSVLGVSSKASQTEVVAAFKKLAKQYHPDRNRSSNAKDRFIEIHEAYSTLKDPVLRVRYDNSLITRSTYQTPDRSSSFTFEPEEKLSAAKSAVATSIVIAVSFLGVVLTALFGAFIIALPVIFFFFFNIVDSIPARMLLLVIVAIPYWFGLYKVFLKRKA